MQLSLELLAPARNKDIGISAIDCGADAVYMAGPAFGAREAASNPVSDIRDLCLYAHRFGAKVYVTLNTILFDQELEEARNMVWKLWEAGADALIVQDLSLLTMDLPPIELHASTQAVVNTPERAKMLEKLGFRRLVLERQLSLEEIKSIRNAVDCELEAFVHGALCVSYSGQCYLSRCLTGRSANRGACIQACRSKYDLVDSSGRTLVRDKSLLSLKDLNLEKYVEKLAGAGICSFKIEGRLKNASYVKNIVRHYRMLLDRLITLSGGEWCRASYGSVKGGFMPRPEATFNRGYTNLFISGKKSGGWNSADAAKSMGEYVGIIGSTRGRRISIETDLQLSNGDGLAFVAEDGSICGMRADVVEGRTVLLKESGHLHVGQKVYRNSDVKFEKELENNMPTRLVRADIHFGKESVSATAENGTTVEIALPADAPKAQNPEKAKASILSQMEKSSGIYSFKVAEIEEEEMKFFPASLLNGFRRELAERLEQKTLEQYRRRERIPAGEIRPVVKGERATYLANCSNNMAEEIYLKLGYTAADPAYELEPKENAVLIRSRYCIRKELGMCPKDEKKAPAHEPLYLVNNGRRLRLSFDCKKCEMTVSL